ncbi:MAG TPA: glycosyltransferase family 2 protein [Anaerolineaceae bacterium]|nr:glycosyltransferase family 2 protein [Anaerolineaceae bacterium]
METLEPCASVIIPVFNEENTVQAIIKRVLAQPCVQEILVVDDHSRDSTYERIKEAARLDDRICVFHHEVNQGKGAAIRTAIPHCKSKYVIIQDADLEYDPNEYAELLEPLLQEKADVVFGSRFLTTRSHRVLYYWHSVGNRFLTWLASMIADLNLSDMETCYKVFRREILQSLELREDRFGFEPEVTMKIAHKNWRIYEVGISYAGRTYKEGKKINAKDGFRAVWCILKYGIFNK